MWDEPLPEFDSHRKQLLWSTPMARPLGTVTVLLCNKLSHIVDWCSNVRKLVRKKPDPPCVVCRGSGRVHCHHCSGQGRTNVVQSTMLPKGEWPKWCTICGGSGLTYCSRCLGTGEYRYLMGFHFMNSNRVDDAHDKS
ncbi:hypothetical protein EZV62_009433 [Acer yangbiense]|uniref:CR-type domain-containing protein n=1 Tax=Acer yangbiense TaxID=1000413 RepID=A0A5C7I0B3_9ROSI|nr:hypothetical protein EZV62_009433 [Acer yangbiense]